MQSLGSFVQACLCLTVIVLAVKTASAASVQGAVAPVANQQTASGQVDDLKAKLENLQKLLQELSKKNDPSKSVKATTLPTTTTTTTAPPAEDNSQHEDESDAAKNLMRLVSQLTPADIAALQVVRAKLISLKEKLDSQNEVNEISQVLRDSLKGQEISSQQDIAQKREETDVHANRVLGLKSGSVREHQMAARRPENSQRDSPADSSQRSFGPFVRELYRQNILHSVKRDLLKTMKMARDNGITLLEVLQALQDDRETGKPESELQSLNKHTGK